MSSAHWPASLRQFVADAFARSTPDNVDAVKAELKELIKAAESKGKLESTDWSEVKLKSLSPPKRPLEAGKSGTDGSSSPKKQKSKAATGDCATRRARKAPKTVMGGQAEDGHDEKPDFGTCSPVAGLSAALEKRYVPLTGPPIPEAIRAPWVLQPALELIKTKWAQQHDYAYAIDQLRSIRQDAIVQNLRSEVVVQAYELSARLAISQERPFPSISGVALNRVFPTYDLAELNACFKPLFWLHKLGLPLSNYGEFLSYRLLSSLVLRDSFGRHRIFCQLTMEDKADPHVKHALDVVRAVNCGNFCRFLRLFGDAPGLSDRLMDVLISRERLQALVTLCKACGPSTLSLKEVTAQLLFDDAEEAHGTLEDYGAAMYKNPTADHEDRLIDCKAAAVVLEQVLEAQKREEKDKGVGGAEDCPPSPA